MVVAVAPGVIVAPTGSVVGPRMVRDALLVSGCGVGHGFARMRSGMMGVAVVGPPHRAAEKQQQPET